jgi:hypothetical protein
MSGDATEVREVVLADVPVRTFWELQHHQEDMLREFALIGIDREQGGADAVPVRLLELVGALRSRLASQRGQLIDELAAAAARGDETVTVSLSVPVAAAAGVKDTCDAYEEADAYCRSGDLLTLAASQDVAALRRAMCDDIVDQLTR